MGKNVRKPQGGFFDSHCTLSSKLLLLCTENELNDIKQHSYILFMFCTGERPSTFWTVIFQLCVLTTEDKPVGDMARAYIGDADAVLDYGLLIAT